MHYLIYAIIAYAFWGMTTLLDKVIREKFINDTKAMVAFFGIVLFIPMAIVAPFVGITFTHTKEIILALLSGSLITLCFLPYAKSLDFEEISRITPLWNITPIFVLLMGLMFLGEKLGVYAYIGFFLLLVGGFLISMRKIKLSNALWLMTLACLFLAISEVLSKYVYITFDYWNGLFFTLAGCFLSSLLLLFFKPVRQHLKTGFKIAGKKVWWQLCLYAVMGFIARIFYYYAIKLGSVSLVTVTSASEAVFVLIYAVIFAKFMPNLLKEELSGSAMSQKIIAIILMSVGLWFIYL
jgi:bacterial/archaeal transporter family protein